MVSFVQENCKYIIQEQARANLYLTSNVLEAKSSLGRGKPLIIIGRLVPIHLVLGEKLDTVKGDFISEGRTAKVLYGTKDTTFKSMYC